MTATPKRTISEFVKDNKKKKCRVCTLPDLAREQLAIAKEKDINIQTRRDYIKAEYGVDLTSEEFSSHQSGKHDE